MLGSHLTLNRTLATHILLVRLQPQPLPPSHREKLVILILIYLTPFFSLLARYATDLGLQWSSMIILPDAFAKTRRRLARGPRRRAWTCVITWAWCVFTFADWHLLVVCTQICIFR